MGETLRKSQYADLGYDEFSKLINANFVMKKRFQGFDNNSRLRVLAGSHLFIGSLKQSKKLQ